MPVRFEAADDPPLDVVELRGLALVRLSGFRVAEEAVVQPVRRPDARPDEQVCRGADDRDAPPALGQRPEAIPTMHRVPRGRRGSVNGSGTDESVVSGRRRRASP